MATGLYSIPMVSTSHVNNLIQIRPKLESGQKLAISVHGSSRRRNSDAVIVHGVNESPEEEEVSKT